MNAYLEDLISDYFGRKFCILVGSGTTALYVCFRALGLPSESKVLFPDFTCETAINAAQFAGLNPVFCDVDLDNYNMNSISVEEAIDRYVISAIVPTHIFGHLIDINKMIQAANISIPIIEDSAQGYGGTISEVKAGGFGSASIISFGEGKLLSCGGGGAILVDDINFAEECRLIVKELIEYTNDQANERREVMNEMIVLRRQRLSCESFATARTAIFRKHKYGYLSLCTEQVRDAIKEKFAEIDNIINFRKRQVSQLDDLFSEFKQIKIPKNSGSNVLWRYSFTVNDGSRNRVFDALQSAGCGVTKFFEPCHRTYAIDDKYFPNTIKLWECIINVKLLAEGHFDISLMRNKIKSAII